MHKAIPDLSDPCWNTDLVCLLTQAATTIARLDERICATPVATPWTLRASWTGYSRALQLQGAEIEEIDIFSHESGVPLPFRVPITTVTDPYSALPLWQARFGSNRRRHWTDGLAASFSPPADWARRPALLRALELTAQEARTTENLEPWLDFPLLLQRLGITRSLLPNLVAGDKALRLAPRDEGIIPRYLRALSSAAADGLATLDSMERARLRSAAALASLRRPGRLTSLAAMLMHRPVLSPTGVSAELAMTISGAGKLLQRAEELELVSEVRQRHNWRIYLSQDLALRFGFIAPRRGRPTARPAASEQLDSLIAAFDAEMKAFDKLAAFLQDAEE